MGNSKSKPKPITTAEAIEKVYSGLVLDIAKDRLENLLEPPETPDEDPPTTKQKPGQGADDDSEDEQPPVPDYRLHELGLGRGVDGTDSRPWVNKSTFQVRMVPEDLKEYSNDLIFTNEGKAVHFFSEEVTSIKELRFNLTLSVTLPNAPVTVSAGADTVRKLIAKQRALGVRTLTRTIAFKPTFDEHFQERIARYMLELTAEQEDTRKEHRGESDVDRLEKFLSDKDSERNERDQDPGNHEAAIQESSVTCLEGVRKYESVLLPFFERYRVTHYVSSVTLGASLFIVESDLSQTTIVKPTTSIGYAPAGVSVGVPEAKIEKIFVHNCKNTHYIGRFKKKSKTKKKSDKSSSADVDDTQILEKKDELVFEVDEKNEAVILVKLEPITNLIESAIIRKSMEEAMKEYVLRQESTREGPYKISCKDAELFLSVEEEDGNALVKASPDCEKASDFYIVPVGDDKYPYEFFIRGQKKEDKGEMRYLTAPVSILGRNDGPLRLESHPRQRDSRFAINRRVTEPFYRLSDDMDVEPKLWLKGEESYLIRCTRRSGRIDGFVAVEREQGKKTYRTTTRKNPRGHDNGNFHMAFRLHPEHDWEKLLKQLNQKQKAKSNQKQEVKTGGASLVLETST